LQFPGLKLVLNIKFSLPEYVEESEDLAYMSLPFFTKISENPFKSKKRHYSIDFNYNEMVIEELKLILPEEYTMLEIPEYTKLRVSDYTFSKMLFANEEYIKCSRIKNLRTRKIDKKYYKKLKKMYEGIIASDEQQVIFKKVQDKSLSSKSEEG